MQLRPSGYLPVPVREETWDPRRTLLAGFGHFHPRVSYPGTQIPVRQSEYRAPAKTTSTHDSNIKWRLVCTAAEASPLNISSIAVTVVCTLAGLLFKFQVRHGECHKVSITTLKVTCKRWNT